MWLNEINLCGSQAEGQCGHEKFLLANDNQSSKWSNWPLSCFQRKLFEVCVTKWVNARTTQAKFKKLQVIRLSLTSLIMNVVYFDQLLCACAQNEILIVFNVITCTTSRSCSPSYGNSLWSKGVFIKVGRTE
jgi:hypothetical protein